MSFALRNKRNNNTVSSDLKNWVSVTFSYEDERKHSYSQSEGLFFTEISTKPLWLLQAVGSSPPVNSSSIHMLLVALDILLCDMAYLCKILEARHCILPPLAVFPIKLVQSLKKLLKVGGRWVGGGHSL